MGSACHSPDFGYGLLFCCCFINRKKDKTVKSSFQSTVKQFVRYFLAIAALFYLVSQGQWRETLKALANFSNVTVTLLCVSIIGGLLFRFLRWYTIIRLEVAVKFRTAAEVDLVSNFVNQLLPSRLSGSAIAPLVISQRTGTKMETSISLQIINTTLYSILYGVTGIFGVILLIDGSPTGILWITGISTVLYLLIGLILLISGFNATTVDILIRRLVLLIDQLPGVSAITETLLERISDLTKRSVTAFQKTLDSPLTIHIYMISWVCSVALFPAFRVSILLDAFGSPFTPIITLPVILIAAYSVTLLPLTPGGIGVTEATAATVFVSLGFSYEVAAATILIDRVLGVYIPALLGWYPVISENSSMLKLD
jgi:uncharacterized protein (TIRG00374 family)